MNETINQLFTTKHTSLHRATLITVSDCYILYPNGKAWITGFNLQFWILHKNLSSTCMKDDLQLGKLKENCLLLKLYRKLRKLFLNPRRESNGLLSAIWVLVAEWLERLTGDQKVAGPIPIWGSETVFWVCDKAWVANSFPSFEFYL